MPQETLGYVKLEWDCPKCGSRNPGPEKTCLSCGAPQPQDVQFVQAAGESISHDDQLKKIAEKGPDIHCSFCGTRNPADATICSQCGADLSKGIRRETGRVVGAFKPQIVKQIACSNCGQQNPETSLKCSNCGASLLRRPDAEPSLKISSETTGRKKNIWLAAGIGILLLACVIAAVVLLVGSLGTRQRLTGTVQAAEWHTSVAIEALGEVQHTGWKNELPGEAQIGTCQDKVYSISNSEPSGDKFNKVCGTPYTVDTGSGVGRVVQDCQYEILQPFCEYTLKEWRVVDNVLLDGTDMDPVFADPTLTIDQRLGQQTSEYVVIFDTGANRYTFHPQSLEEYQRFQAGSSWELSINAFDQVISVQPAQ
jgi:ribosomal protein L40E